MEPAAYEPSTAADISAIWHHNGSARTLVADACICTIPLPVFAKLETNLPAPFMAAAANAVTKAAGKVGWQAERFWERDANIYGGISWTTDVIDQIWYPSSGYLSAKGGRKASERNAGYRTWQLADCLHRSRVDFRVSRRTGADASRLMT